MNNTIEAAFVETLAEFTARASIARLLAGHATVAEYAAYLRQVFHHTRENPQVQAWATAYFKGDQRSQVRTFFKHALSEVGHDELARNDLARLGFDVEGIECEEPLPETRGLVAYPYHQVQFVDPLGYLGYLYFLERTPTTLGSRLSDALGPMGIPEDACTFLADHISIDMAHNKLMDGYLATLVRDERDATIVANAVRATGRLYGNMIEAAFAVAEETRATSAPTELEQTLALAH